MALAADGMDKNGKSHYAIITTPDPIMVVTNDTGTEHIVKKAIRQYKRRVTGVMELAYETPDPRVIAKADVDSSQQKLWQKAWQQYIDGMSMLAEEKPRTTRTLIVDTHTAIYELAQLAKFGKLRGNKDNQHLWAEINSEMHRAFWDLYKQRPEMNIILLHKCKKEYKTNSAGKEMWTGRYERSANRDVGYWVDVTLRFGWDGRKRKFFTEIDSEQPIRYNPGGADDPSDNPLIGRRWEGEDSAFPYLAMDVFPETQTTPEVWGV